MLIKTKHFGEIDLSDDKIITFERGLLGFEQYLKYTILFDIEKGEKPIICWLQCVEDEKLAFPVINPFLIKEDYDPIIEDELLQPLGQLTDENIAIFVTLTVPEEVEKMTVNLKAPILINSDTKKACQIVVDNQDYQIKYGVFNALKQLEKKGEK